MSPRPARPDAPERCCIASGQSGDAADLIRFVLDPDGRVVPDLAGRLPGRGLWVAARRPNLEDAVRRRRFAQAARRAVTVPDDLADQVDRLLDRHARDLIGLARRAGQVTMGYDRVHERLKQPPPVALILEAADGAEAGRRRLAASAPGVPALAVFTAAELAEALGRDSVVVHAALEPTPLAGRVHTACRRLADYRGLPVAGVAS